MTPILGPGAKLRGYLLEDSTTIKLLKPGGMVLGIFHKLHGYTTTGGNAFIGYGNLLLTLLEDRERRQNKPQSGLFQSTRIKPSGLEAAVWWVRKSLDSLAG